MNKTKEYMNGYDAGLNGPTKENCHYSFFGTKEQTRDWEAGNAAGKKAKANQKKRSVKPNPRKK